MTAFLYQRSSIEGRGACLFILLFGNVMFPPPLRFFREDRFARSWPVARRIAWLRKTSIAAPADFRIEPYFFGDNLSCLIIPEAAPAVQPLRCSKLVPVPET